MKNNSGARPRTYLVLPSTVPLGLTSGRLGSSETVPYMHNSLDRSHALAAWGGVMASDAPCMREQLRNQPHPKAVARTALGAIVREGAPVPEKYDIVVANCALCENPRCAIAKYAAKLLAEAGAA